MTALAEDPPPSLRTLGGMRALLPQYMWPEFDAEWAGVDLDDLAAVARLRDQWWHAAAVASDPRLLADLASAVERRPDVAGPMRGFLVEEPDGLGG